MGPRDLLTACGVLAALCASPAWALEAGPADPELRAAVRGGGGSPAVQGEDGSPLVHWVAEPELRGLARRLAADGRLVAPFPGIGAGAWGGDTVTVRLVHEVERHAPPGSEVDREWVAGFALLGGDTVVVEVGTEKRSLGELRPVLRHELAHVALDRATGGRAPRWLQEGYAQLASGEWGARRAWRLRFLFLREGGASLRNLSVSFPAEETAARTAYLLSYTAVRELYGLAGERGLASFFSRLRQGASVDDALRSVYGLTLAQFERKWKAAVKDRYGWLYVLSRAGLFWVVVAVAVLVVWWIRRRRTRRQLEELRREEREEAIRDLLEGRQSSGPRPGLAPGNWYPEEDPDAWRGDE